MVRKGVILTIVIVASLVMLMALLSVGCGTEGPAGIQGPEGPQGPAGLTGTTGLTGATGATGAEGIQGPAGIDATAAIAGEQCAVCHKEVGVEAHQATYDTYSDASKLGLTIDSVASVTNGSNFDTTITFSITKNGAAFVDVAKLPSLAQKTFYAVKYNSATGEFLDGKGFSAPTVLPTATPGQYTITNASTSPLPYDVTAAGFNGLIFAYVAEGKLDVESSYTLFDNVASVAKAYGTAQTTDPATYMSTANVSGCEKCHGTPYMKHGYRVAEVSGLTDFSACKVCHYDNRNGGHQDWQVLVEDPERYLELQSLVAAAKAESPVDTDHDTVAENFTTDEAARYAYKASVMNDVHMSHAMEFAYPQSIANCATCHSGANPGENKLDEVLTDANFTIATCKSCHPIDGPTEGTQAKRAPALKAVWEDAGVASFHNASLNCGTCHSAAGGASLLSEIHTGYDSTIYAEDGTKYSEEIEVSIDSATLSGNDLTITFSATGTAGGLNAADIEPEVLTGLYGYDTKNFIVNGHDRYDSNGDGKVDRQDNAKGAYMVGTTHSYFTTVSEAAGTWTVKADLTEWAGLITNGTVKRIEIAVIPILENADGEEVALNAPSITFNIATGALEDDYFQGDNAVVDVEGCNACHDALATTFHTPDRGGNIVVCKLCHVTLAGGSHLEMQSRGIDSYVHAIHTFQPFDIGDVDFTDPVEALGYEHHVESTFPNFTTLNCESCHNPGTYDVPDQSESLPGLLSASDKVTTMDRNIGTIPSYVTGPATRACGGCHRSELINEDAAGELAAFLQHTRAGGYLVENEAGKLNEVIETLFAMFN